MKKRRLTRRDVLKAAQVGGLGACGALGLLGRPAAAEDTRGTCRICTMHCGLAGTTRGHRLVRVEGELSSRTRGFICHHGWAIREIVHSPERVRRPLRREGSRFVEVSWEEALSGIAERLLAIKREHGPQAVALQAGWPLVRHPLLPFLMRFCQAFGTPNFATVASLCASSGHIARMLVSGSFLHPDLRKTRTLLLWGANPTFADPPLAHLVAQKGLEQNKLIVVDPIRTELAEAATLHLRPRPGTDGALALGMLHVTVRDRLHDARFVEENTVGFEELSRLVEPYTPAEVERLTSVPRADVEEATHLFARNGPGAVWDSLGVQHHVNGLQATRAITALAAVLGYIDVPGGLKLRGRAGPGFWEQPLPAFYSLATPEPVPAPVAARPIGYDEYPLFEVFNREAQGVLFPRAILEDKPYPLRALVCFASNPLVTQPASARWREAARRLSLLVSVDPFLSETGAQAHYVLPAATFAEAPSVDPGDQDTRVQQSSLAPPQHQSWPDWKILVELARALGLGAYFPWSSFREAQEAPRKPYMRDPARERWPMPMPAGTPPPRFATASGKLELSSQTLARFGYTPLPEWTPPATRPTPEYPLLLVSGPRTRVYINSQFRQIPSIRDKQPEPFVELHPEAARRCGVHDGAHVAVVSPEGRITLRARVTDRVHPEIAVLPAGWAVANANELTSPEGADPISGFPALRSQVCRVEPLGAT